MTIPKILISCGTRPEIIKLAPIYLELQRRGADVEIAHTGQHPDMATGFFAAFGIRPDYQPALDPPKTESSGQVDNLTRLTCSLMQNCSDILARSQPTIVIVQGDTHSALAMALSAFHRQLAIAHVEAGLRSYQEYQPFPEEKSRILIGQLAHWHFAPSLHARNHLLRENIDAAAIHVVGNTMVDAMQLALTHSGPLPPEEVLLRQALSSQLPGKCLLLATAHRRENQAADISRIAANVRIALEQNQQLMLVWAMHPSPTVQESVRSAFANLTPELATRCFLTPPLGYPMLQWVLRNAWLVLTDSGGIQEEAGAIRCPALVLRAATERSELIDAGLAQLVPPSEIPTTISRLLCDAGAYDAMRDSPFPYGSGDAAIRICDILLG